MNLRPEEFVPSDREKENLFTFLQAFFAKFKQDETITSDEMATAYTIAHKYFPAMITSTVLDRIKQTAKETTRKRHNFRQVEFIWHLE